MLILKKIAVTGGVASGKSTVCKFFEELGACVVSADAIGHEMLNLESPVGHRVVDLLGDDIVERGQISRSRVADKVFRDSKQLKALEAILHPAIFQRIEERYAAAQKAKLCSLFVVEMPLLFETHTESDYDATIAVLRDETLCGDSSDYERRMQHQLSPALKAAKATYTLHNNGSLDELRIAVRKLYHILT